jgi:hypothetical protein
MLPTKVRLDPECVGDCVGCGFWCVSNLRIAIAVYIWQLRPRGKNQRINVRRLHLAGKRLAEGLLVFQPLEGAFVFVGRQRVHGFVEGGLMQRVDELGFGEILDGRIRNAGMLREPGG